MSEVTTIDDVLEELDHIIAITTDENSPLGIFAWVYRRTTAKVVAGIKAERFADNERMEQFDVAFARLFIKAYYGYRRGGSVFTAWEHAFRVAEEPGNALIIQHLLLGMNAHINLDLAIAADRVSPDGEIETLRDDFMTINLLLEELIDEVQLRMGRVSPLMFLLDLAGKRSDEEIVNWSITRARMFAWNFACRLDRTPRREKDSVVCQADFHVANIAECVAKPPGFFVPKVLALVRFFEEKNTRTVIETLKE